MPDRSDSGTGALGLAGLRLFAPVLSTLLLSRDVAAIHTAVAELLHIFGHVFLCFTAYHVKEHQNL